MTARVEADQELEMLRSLLPVCSWCRKIRSEDGRWQTIEAYLHESDGSTVTHGMCPECNARLTEDLDEGRPDPSVRTSALRAAI